MPSSTRHFKGKNSKVSKEMFLKEEDPESKTESISGDRKDILSSANE